MRVYSWDGGSWVQRGLDIDGEAALNSSGQSVCLSADGSIVAIGAPFNDGNGEDSGHVRVFKWDGFRSWIQRGGTLCTARPQQATEAGTVCLSHLTAPSWQLALARMTEMEKVVDMFVFSLGMEAVGSNRGAILTVTQKTNAAVEVCLYQMMETSSQLELLAGTDLVTEIAACGFMRGTSEHLGPFECIRGRKGGRCLKQRKLKAEPCGGTVSLSADLDGSIVPTIGTYNNPYWGINANNGYVRPSNGMTTVGSKGGEIS